MLEQKRNTVTTMLEQCWSKNSNTTKSMLRIVLINIMLFLRIIQQYNSNLASI